MYREICKCRICGHTELKTVLDLGMQKLTGVFPSAGEDIEEGPLVLVKCQNAECGCVQLRHSFEKEKMYGENYGYRSGLNQSMVAHLTEITNRIKERIPLSEGDTVLDIGSNDGTLLSTYNIEGLDLIGMDPTGKKFQKYYPPNVELIADFFTADNVMNARPGKKVKVVTSIAMFYDLESPIAFAKDIEKILADDGLWIMEQSYMPAMIETMSYDTICHEHLEFYCLKQIKLIADHSDLKIIDVCRNDINGGSFQLVLAKKASACHVSDQVQELLEWEDREGYTGFEIFEKFTRDVQLHREQLKDFLKKAKQNGKKVCGYGASTKGNVLLQYCGLTKEDIAVIAEVNEDKYGKVTPGSGIPIVSEADARKLNPDYYIVLPWHFKDNILEKEKNYIEESGSKFVFPLPRFEIIGY